MFDFKKNKKTEDVNVEDEITRQIEQLEAEEIGIEEEIEEIKEKTPEVAPVVKKVEEEKPFGYDQDEESDFLDTFDDDDDEEEIYKKYLNSKSKEPVKEKKTEKEEVTENEIEEPVNQPQQLNIFLQELDARVSRIESILFRLMKDGKQ